MTGKPILAGYGMTLEILQYPHPILAAKAEPIPAVTPEIRELAAAMRTNSAIAWVFVRYGLCTIPDCYQREAATKSW